MILRFFNNKETGKGKFDLAYSQTDLAELCFEEKAILYTGQT